MSLINILIVDDDEDDILIIKDYIRQSTLDVNIDEAWSFDDALTAMEVKKYDIALIDYRLGAQSGLELIKQIRDNGRGTSTVLLTGQGDEELAVAALKQGASDYLTKAKISTELITRTITNVINLKEARRKHLEAEEALKRSEAKYRELVTLLPAVIIELSPEGNLEFVNDFAITVTGYTLDEFINKDVFKSFLRLYTDDDFENLKKRIVKHDIRNDEIRVRTASGISKVFSLNARAIFNVTGMLTRIICICTDVSELVDLKERLHSLSIIDDLTGLYNRRGFLALADQQLKLTNRYRKPLIIVFIDLDGLKAINDTHGHAEGDRAIVGCALVLKETFRESDIIGRMGGDEFVIIVTNTDISHSPLIEHRLSENLAVYNQKSSLGYDLSLSFGIVAYNLEKSVTLDELISQADKLMYSQKQQKRCARQPSL